MVTAALWSWSLGKACSLEVWYDFPAAYQMSTATCLGCGVIAGPPGIVISARQEGAHLFNTVLYTVGFLIICLQRCPADIQLAAPFQHLVHLFMGVFRKHCSVPATTTEPWGYVERDCVFRSSKMGLDGDFVDRRSGSVVWVEDLCSSDSHVVTMACLPGVGHHAVPSSRLGNHTQLPPWPVHVGSDKVTLSHTLTTQGMHTIRRFTELLENDEKYIYQ